MYTVIYVAPFMALMFWVVFVLILGLPSPGKVLAATVALNGALFWTVNTIGRVWFGYVGPSTAFSLWSTFFYLHVGVSLIAMTVVVGAYNDRVYLRLAPVRRFVAQHTGHADAAETGA